jgi:hypothetical protein
MSYFSSSLVPNVCLKKQIDSGWGAVAGEFARRLHPLIARTRSGGRRPDLRRCGETLVTVAEGRSSFTKLNSAVRPPPVRLDRRPRQALENVYSRLAGARLCSLGRWGCCLIGRKKHNELVR